MTSLDQLSALSVDALIDRIDTLVGQERRTTADIVLSLAALRRAQLDIDLGWSLWSYCHDHLRMPESTAMRYTKSAELIVDFPIAADYLRDGRLSPSTLNLLKGVLTQANHVTVFDRASGLSQKKTALLVAELNPQPDIKESCRFVPERSPQTPQVTERAPTPALPPERPLFIDRSVNPDAPSLDLKIRTSTAEVTPSPAEPTASPTCLAGPGAVLLQPFIPTAEIKPLRKGHYVLRLNVDQNFIDQLEEARLALSHSHPKANESQVLQECMRRTIDDLARRQHGALKPKKTARRTSAAEVPHSSVVASAAAPSTSGTSTAEVVRSSPVTSAAEVRHSSAVAAAAAPSTSVTSAAEVPHSSAVASAAAPSTSVTSAAEVMRSSPVTSAAELQRSSAATSAGAPSISVTSAAEVPCSSSATSPSAPSTSVTSTAEVTRPATAATSAAEATLSTSNRTPIPTLATQPVLGDSLQLIPPELRGVREPSTEVKRQVSERDGGCCSFIGLKGHRCGSRYQLEYDHSVAYATGGEPTVENTRLLCKRHNLRVAQKTFGEKMMSRYLRGR